jgi:hypothetical protein
MRWDPPDTLRHHERLDRIGFIGRSRAPAHFAYAQPDSRNRSVHAMLAAEDAAGVLI